LTDLNLIARGHVQSAVFLIVILLIICQN